MKKRKNVIIVLLIFLIIITITTIFYRCYDYKKHSEYYQVKQPEIETKKILKLGHKIAEENFEIKTQQKNMEFSNVILKEIPSQRYKNQLEMLNIVKKLETELNITINNKWKYYVHSYNDENTSGVIGFIYWINDEIETTKSIILPVEKNTINTVFYSYLNNSINEEDLIERLEKFKNSTVQEKYELSESEIFLEEKTVYLFNYQNNSFYYTYNLFFEVKPLLEINNDYGCEYLID